MSTTPPLLVRAEVLVLLICGITSSSDAQTFAEKLLRHDRLDSTDLHNITAFETLSEWVLKSEAFVDTTVVLSGTILYSIISLGNATGTSSLYYLLSYDRHREQVIDLAYLHEASDIEQDVKRYSWTTHSIWSNGQVGIIEYDCRQWPSRIRGKVKEVQATRRRFWTVLHSGQIQVGHWEKP